MGWADWMIGEKSLEEELELERTVREIRACTDAEALWKTMRGDGPTELASHKTTETGC